MLENDPLIAVCTECEALSCRFGNCKKYKQAEKTLATKAEYRFANKQYTANGFTGTLTEWAEKLGVDRRTIISRLQRGVPFEAAIVKNYRIPFADKKRYDYNGKLYSLAELAEMTGLTVAGAYYRVSKHGVEACIRRGRKKV